MKLVLIELSVNQVCHDPEGKEKGFAFDDPDSSWPAEPWDESEWEKACSTIENMAVSRWWNPMLLAVTNEQWEAFKQKGEHGEGDANMFGVKDEYGDFNLATLAVAIPKYFAGYGTLYAEYIKENRKRLKLK